MKRIIGITLNISHTSLFGNGINQNAIYLAELINNIRGYSSILICAVSDLNDLKTLQLIAGDKIKCVRIEDSFQLRLDVLIVVGLAISKNNLAGWKTLNSNIKLVQYKCGNQFFIDTECMIYDINKDLHSWDYMPVPDQVWSIPQMEKTNLDYYSIVHNQKNATVVPFIWSPSTIEKRSKDIEAGNYNGRHISRIGIMEPNASFMKHAWLPVLIADQAYKNGLNIDILRVFSGIKLKENERFNQLVVFLELYKSTKLSLEKRFPIVDMLKDHIDIIVSWQMENNLNYLYLDAAWLGYPVLHNANLCQDIGYYYSNNNIFEGAKLLEDVVKTHSKNQDYLEKNRSLIHRYLPENEKIQREYARLLDNLIHDKFEKGKFSWKNNTIFT